MENGLDGLMKQAKEMQERWSGLDPKLKKRGRWGIGSWTGMCAYVRVARCQIS